MLRALGGETETVKVVGSEGLVGGFEWIAIHASDAKALEIADKIKAALADFSIVDLDHFHEVEREEADLTWKNCFGPMERIAYIRELRDSFKFCDLAEPHRLRARQILLGRCIGVARAAVMKVWNTATPNIGEAISVAMGLHHSGRPAPHLFKA